MLLLRPGRLGKRLSVCAVRATECLRLDLQAIWGPTLDESVSALGQKAIFLQH